jgi:hypothetical protein
MCRNAARTRETRDNGSVRLERPTARKVPRRQRARLADELQRVLGVLPETNEPADRAIRRDVRRFADALRGIGDDSA